MPRARCAAAPSGSLWQGVHFYATCWRCLAACRVGLLSLRKNRNANSRPADLRVVNWRGLWTRVQARQPRSARLWHLRGEHPGGMHAQQPRWVVCLCFFSSLGAWFRSSGFSLSFLPCCDCFTSFPLFCFCGRHGTAPRHLVVESRESDVCGKTSQGPTPRNGNGARCRQQGNLGGRGGPRRHRAPSSAETGPGSISLY